MKRSFFGLIKPQFRYETLGTAPEPPVEIPLPDRVTLLCRIPFGSNPDPAASSRIRTGDAVKTGQKLILQSEPEASVISTVTGKVADISRMPGDYGVIYTAVTIETAKTEEIDEDFSARIREMGPDFIKDYFPGICDPDIPVHREKSIETLIIYATDKDLFTITNQYAATKQVEAAGKGISILKKVFHIENVVLVLPENLLRSAGGIGGASGVEVRSVGNTYPSASKAMLAAAALGKMVPAGCDFADLGIAMLSIQAVASVGEAFLIGRPGTEKLLTLVDKDGKMHLVSARIGTPVHAVLAAFGITVNEGDRLIAGGPMTGSALYTEMYPVTAETDTIMVQDHADIPEISDYPCINCGECVRICPVRIPVNMLVRVCEAKQYEDAADKYDLWSCIDCGLCSFVCVARIPVYQYIRLAKYELSCMDKEQETAEEKEQEKDETGEDAGNPENASITAEA